MAVFRTEPDGQRGAMNAVRAAIGMQKRLRDFMRERNARGLQIFEVGVGINTGQVVMGNVGAMNRMDYTVIGDTVNVAARLEQMAQGQEIIVSESTYLYCKAHIPMRRKGEISVKNRAEPVKCYEVVL
jgi:adenylate cyclase